MVLLEDQDRSLWDRAQIDEGLRLVEDARPASSARTRSRPGSPPSTAAPSAPRRPTGADRPPLRAADPDPALARDRAEPRDRGRDGEGPEQGLELIDAIEGLDGYGPSTSAAPTCCGARAGTRRPPTPTGAGWSSARTRSSAPFWSAERGARMNRRSTLDRAARSISEGAQQPKVRTIGPPGRPGNIPGQPLLGSIGRARRSSARGAALGLEHFADLVEQVLGPERLLEQLGVVLDRPDARAGRRSPTSAGSAGPGRAPQRGRPARCPTSPASPRRSAAGRSRESASSLRSASRPPGRGDHLVAGAAQDPLRHPPHARVVLDDED